MSGRTIHRYIFSGALIALPWCLFGQIADSTWAQYARMTEAQKSSKPGPAAYRIQLFSGNRSEALLVRNQARQSVPDSSLVLQFDAPYFKVYGGVYTYRMQAEKHLPAWRVLFPGAFVVQAPVRRGSTPPRGTMHRP